MKDVPITSALTTSARILGGRRSAFMGVVTLMVLGALLDALGILTLVPLLAATGLEGTQGGTGTVYGFFRDAFAALDTTVSITTVLSLLVAILSTSAFVRYGERVRGTALTEAHKKDLRSRVFRSIVLADWSFHSRTRRHDVLHALTDDVARVGQSLQHALTAASGTITAAALVGLAFYLSPATTASALVVAGGIAGVLRARTLRVREASEAFSSAAQSLHATTAELLRGVRTAKIHADEDRHLDDFDDAAQALSDAWTETAGSEAETRALLSMAAVIALSLLFWVNVGFLGMGPATMLVLIYLFVRLIPVVSRVRESVRSFRVTSAAHGRLERLLQRSTASAEPAVWRGAATPPLGEGIELQNVTFTPDEHTTVECARVSNLNLVVPAYAMTAIVSSSSGHCRTVADLVTGIVSPEKGRILVDGRALSGADLRGWRKRIGHVSPEVSFATTSIRAHLGLKNDEDREGEIQDVLQIVRLDGLMMRLSYGKDAVMDGAGMEENGRVRLALARALLRRPQFLVWEAVGGTIDVGQEALIARALGGLRGKATVLVLTDRPSVARRADLIHVIGGNAVESGSWEQLVQDGGRLKALAQVQEL